MKRIFTLIVLVTLAWQGYAQQDAMVSQYMFNGLLLNPAYAGTHDDLTATLLHRSQWVGFDKAPRTQSFTLHGKMKDDRSGWGVVLGNDFLGRNVQHALHHVDLVPDPVDERNDEVEAR